MLREMVRKESALSEQDMLRIVKSQNYGILSVHGDDGFPYGVPVNYVYHDGRFYIHGPAVNSHRMDGVRRDPKVCFTIVDRHELIEEAYTTAYSSVIVFGTASELQTDEEKQRAMLLFVHTLAPSALEKVRNGCVKESACYSIVVITPVRMTGKASV